MALNPETIFFICGVLLLGFIVGYEIGVMTTDPDCSVTLDTSIIVDWDPETKRLAMENCKLACEYWNYTYNSIDSDMEDKILAMHDKPSNTGMEISLGCTCICNSPESPSGKANVCGGCYYDT